MWHQGDEVVLVRPKVGFMLNPEGLWLPINVEAGITGKVVEFFDGDDYGYLEVGPGLQVDFYHDEVRLARKEQI